MTTIAIDARKVADYGIGTYVRGLIGALARIDQDAQYRLLAPRAQRELLPDLPDNFDWVDEDSPGYSLREQLAFGRTLQRLAPDLFHSPHYVLPARTPARVVVTIHDLIHLVHPEFLPNRLALPYARWMLQRAARRASRILTVSRATAADLGRRLAIPSSRIEVIANGVDDRFRAPLSAETVSRELAAVGVAPGYFLFVGNPKPHKNLALLLEAFARFEAPASRLVLAGGSEKRSAAGGSGDRRVTHLGRVEDRLLPALYRGALALLFPSLYEGFGLPVAEAMAGGTPVIASSTAAVAEIAGGAAELVSPLDGEGWTAAIRRIDADPERRRQLAAAGRDRSAGWRWETAARRTLETYRAVLAERPE